MIVHLKSFGCNSEGREGGREREQLENMNNLIAQYYTLLFYILFPLDTRREMVQLSR